MMRGEGEFFPKEVERKPRYRFMITRHAERLPSGELSPEGVEHAKQKGTIIKNAEVIKAYASDHPSGRAFKTGDLISKESGIVSPETGEQYATRKVKDIQYDVFQPDIYDQVVPGLKLLIEENTLREIAEINPELFATIEAETATGGEKVMKTGSNGNPMVNIEKLSIPTQMQIGPIRQKYQKFAFDYFFSHENVAIHRCAMGLGQQLVHEMNIADRYAKVRQEKPVKGDVVLNTATHGLFIESLLREAGVIVLPDGTKKEGLDDFNAELGGYIQPAESVYLDIDDPKHIPDLIPVVFENPKREAVGKVFVDRSKLLKLNEEYLQWRMPKETNAPSI